MSAVEPLLFLCGIATGVLLNPRLPKWGAAALVPFVAFNLFLASGIKELLSRMMARRGLREVVAFFFVLIAATPQVMVATHAERKVAVLFPLLRAPVLVWSAVAHLIAGRDAIAAIVALAVWTGAAYLFGRRQFERTLHFDENAAGSSASMRPDRSRMAWFFEWPGRVFRDPLAVLIEKEIRVLVRSPRFRLVFFMGFSFGVLIWAPLALNGGNDSFLRRNFLSFAGAYALMLIGDVCFYNVLGFDRTAAQTYFAVPVPFRSALVAKNIAAFAFVLLELVVLSAVCLSLRLLTRWTALAEGFAVIPVLSWYFMAIGNLTSVHGPRPVNPAKSTRMGSPTKMQFVLLLAYPVAAAPIALAFLARWAFESEAAFFAVVLGAALAGACVYKVAMESAVTAAEARAESIVATLSKGEGPIA